MNQHLHTAPGNTEPTADERKAIERLQKAIDKMPKTLWLFSNGKLQVMKYCPDGSKSRLSSGSYDSGYVVGEISGIESDGGDW